MIPSRSCNWGYGGRGIEGPLRVELPHFGARAAKSGVGAFSSLPRTPAKVPSSIICRPPSSCNANRWPVEFHGLRPGKLPESQLDGGEGYKGGQGFGRYAANREWRSSPRACRSCTVVHPVTPRGSVAPTVSIQRPADYSRLPINPTVLLCPYRYSPSR
jgi:hypothetical protein